MNGWLTDEGKGMDSVSNVCNNAWAYTNMQMWYTFSKQIAHGELKLHDIMTSTTILLLHLRRCLFTRRTYFLEKGVCMHVDKAGKQTESQTCNGRWQWSYSFSGCASCSRRCVCTISISYHALHPVKPIHLLIQGKSSLCLLSKAVISCMVAREIVHICVGLSKFAQERVVMQ